MAQTFPLRSPLEELEIKKNILIIDDDDEMCQELLEILSDEGYHVRVAMDGFIGKQLIEENLYRVIILDLKLPGLNGIEILKIIRSAPLPLKVLVLSGRPLGDTLIKSNTESMDREEAALEMADLVMNKPVNVDFLLKKIRELSAL